MNDEQNLINKNFKLIGINSKELKIYARNTYNNDGNLIIHKVNHNGESLGIEFFEKETIKILSNCDFLKS